MLITAVSSGGDISTYSGPFCPTKSNVTNSGRLRMFEGWEHQLYVTRHVQVLTCL